MARGRRSERRKISDAESVLVDGHDPPSVPQPINPGNRQRLDDETQSRFGIDIERDAKRGPNCTRVDHERRRAGRDFGESLPDPGDLICKTFTAGRP